MSILKSGARSNLARAGISLAVAMTAVGALATTSQAAIGLTPSVGSGPIIGGNTITLAPAAGSTARFTSSSLLVQFAPIAASAVTSGTCPAAAAAYAGTAATATTTVTATTVRFITTTPYNKLSVKVPDLTPASGTVSQNWQVCAYNGAYSATAGAGSTPGIANPGSLVGRATYVVAVAPRISDGTDHSGDTTPATPALNWSATGATGAVVPAMTPTSGPALGGQTVTINGAYFPTPAVTPATATSLSATNPLSATLDGVALTNITPISATQFTAVTPPHAASATPVKLTVTTNGGTATATALYTYKNGITVSPTTAVSNTRMDIDVQGVGFNSMSWDADNTDGSDPQAATPHVYLVQGAYDPTAQVAGDIGSKTVGPATECIDVAVISDTELVCTVDAKHNITDALGVVTVNVGALADGTYTVTVVDTGAVAALASLDYITELSSGATFTVADF